MFIDFDVPDPVSFIWFIGVCSRPTSTSFLTKAIDLGGAATVTPPPIAGRSDAAVFTNEPLPRSLSSRDPPSKHATAAHCFKQLD